MALGPMAFTDRAAPSLPEGILRVVFGSAIGPALEDTLPLCAVPLPALSNEEAGQSGAVMYGHGVGHLHHHIDGDTLVTGPLAPRSGPTTAGLTADQAETVFTFSGQPTAGKWMIIGIGQSPNYSSAVSTCFIFFVSTLSSANNRHEVLIGATAADTINNLAALLQGSSGHGSTYINGWLARGFTAPGQYEIPVRNDVEYVTNDATTITIRAVTPGVRGNTYASSDIDANLASTGFSGGVSATGDAPLSGRYRHGLSLFRSADGARTAMGDLTEVTLDGPGNITVTTAESIFSRDEMDYWTWWRTNFGAADRYKGGDVLPTDLPATDDLTDEELAALFATIYDSSTHRAYEHGYPTRRAFLEVMDGKVFAAGVTKSEDYSAGTFAVTNGAYTGTLSNGHITEKWIGRTVFLTDDLTPYLVVGVNEASEVVTFNRPIESATDSYSYVCKDLRNPFGIDWCASRLVNQWPADNNLEDISSANPTGITGIVAAWESLIVFTMTNASRLSDAGGGVYRPVPVHSGHGLFTHQALVPAGGALYWIGPNGVHRWYLGAEPQNLSSPQSDADGARGIQETLNRVNLDQVDLIQAYHSQSEQTIRWILPLDGDEVCRHELVLDLRTHGMSLDYVGPRTCMGGLSHNGKHHTLAGDPWGNIIELDIGDADGGHGASRTVFTVSAWDGDTLAATLNGTTPLSGLDLSGARGILVNLTTGAWEERTIVSNDDSDVILDQYPDLGSPSGYTFLLGGIAAWARSGRSGYDAPERPKHISSVTVPFVPQDAAAKVFVGLAIDSGEFEGLEHSSLGGVVDSADLSDTDGEHKFYFRGAKAHRVGLEFLALEPGVDVHLTGFSVGIRVRGEASG